MFDKATRLKLRFITPLGPVSVEDLWDLPLTTTKKSTANLDDIAIQLDKELKDSSTVSFVKKTTKANDETRLKFDIVRHIIDVKLAEAEEAEKKRENAEKKKKILELMAKKQDAALENKPLEELQSMLQGL